MFNKKSSFIALVADVSSAHHLSQSLQNVHSENKNQNENSQREEKWCSKAKLLFPTLLFVFISNRMDQTVWTYTS